MKNSTIAIIVAVTAIVIGWDIVVAVNDVQGDTVSEIIQKFSYNHPVIALFGGVLTSHFFWPGKPVLKSNLRYLVLISIGVIAASMGLWGVAFFPLYPMLVGLALGRMFWPQNVKP